MIHALNELILLTEFLQAEYCFKMGLTILQHTFVFILAI